MKLTRWFCLAVAGILGFGFPARSEPVPVAKYSKPIYVACVGDSITAGTGLVGIAIDWSYPSQLSRMLGNKWEVHNFGIGGTTMLQKSDNPYRYKAPLQSKPDVVIIALGTNDLKPKNWNQAAYVSDYKAMISAFQALPNKPLIYLCLPTPVVPPGRFDIPSSGPDMLIPLIGLLASENHLDLIDFNAPMASHPEWLPDRVHPNRDGSFAMAKAVYAVLTGTDYTGEMLPPPSALAPKPAPAPTPTSTPTPASVPNPPAAPTAK